MTNLHRYLPPDTSPSDIRLALGLVSDTHFGQRLERLPEALFDALAGVDLILHAGDVGDLSVLDQISTIAPVIAVQGNDDSGEAKLQLPVQQIVAVGGQRVFMWHSHFLDPEQERASRIGDELASKLDRTIDAARAAGASLALFGHWHIPLVWNTGDLLVVNPGALASANEISRQDVRTVAIGFLRKDGTWCIRHITLDDVSSAFDPAIVWEAGFASNHNRFQSSILDRQMRQQMPIFKAALAPELVERLRGAIADAAKRVWAGEAPLLTWRDIEREAIVAGILTTEEERQLRALIAELCAEGELSR